MCVRLDTFLHSECVKKNYATTRPYAGVSQTAVAIDDETQQSSDTGHGDATIKRQIVENDRRSWLHIHRTEAAQDADSTVATYVLMVLVPNFILQMQLTAGKEFISHRDFTYHSA